MNLGMKLSGLVLCAAFAGTAIAQEEATVASEAASQAASQAAAADEALRAAIAQAEAEKAERAKLEVQKGELSAQCSAVFTVIRRNDEKQHKADPKKNPNNGSQYNGIISNFEAYARVRLTAERRNEVFFDYTGQLMKLEVQQERAVDRGDMDLLNRVHARQTSDLMGCIQFNREFVMPSLVRK